MNSERQVSKKNEQQKQMTRRQRRKARKKKRRKQKKPRRRIFPIWLRIILVLLGCVAAVIGGVMFGYGILGDGDPKDALDKETWQHIIDIVTKRE
ncbi:MAG TPA: DNA-directed RNA polymerase subunit beta [Bacillota bacterium]|nr:DNA-directed RNA polymerase subunit beta [Bacillota bacterium]